MIGVSFRRLRAVIVTLGLIFGSTITLFDFTAFATTAPDIGPWQASSNSLPAAVTAQTSATNNDYVYILGGTPDYAAYSDIVYYAHLNSDGSVGAWQTSTNPLPVGLDYSSAVTANDYLYLFGGSTSGGPTNAVYYAHLNSDGSVGAWQTSTNFLPGNSVVGTAASYGGYIYEVGGFPNSYNDDYTNAVYYAHLNSDGSVDTWQTSANSFPEGVAGATSLASNGYLYQIAGARGKGDSDFKVSSEVTYAHLNSDGSVDTWQTSANNIPSSALLMSAAVSSSNYVYLIAGQRGENSTQISGSVYYSSLPVFDTTPPTIYPTVDTAPNTYGWNNSPVTVTFHCADESGGSGLASCTPPVTVSTQGQNQAVTGTAVDNAGNATSITVYVSLNSGKPSIVATQSPAAVNGWNNTDVTVTYTCADTLSLVHTCSDPTVLTTESNNLSATGTALDYADNTNSVTQSPIKIDKTAPTATTPTMSNRFISFLNRNSTIGATVTDPNGAIASGVVSGEYYIDTDPGQGHGTAMTYSNGKISKSITINGLTGLNHTLYMRSKDAAGNWSATTSITFTYV